MFMLCVYDCFCLFPFICHIKETGSGGAGGANYVDKFANSILVY